MLYPKYFDAIRRLLGEGDLRKRITHAGLGTSNLSPNAVVPALTNAVLTPVTAVEYHPTNPRNVRIHFLLPFDEGVGLGIREIGLLTADGTLVYREVRELITKTADMQFGDVIDLDV